jgi:hypothetical protein
MPSNSGNLCVFGEIEHRQDGYSENCICAVTPLCDQTQIDRANAKLIAASPCLYEYAKSRSLHGDVEARNMLDSLKLSE